jgi:Asp-tRNA(Asn)/Glu-tRNA(Gln) amidotransferase A subunit family amidase
MPTTVQIMGKSMMDEELVQVMKIVEAVLSDE